MEYRILGALEIDIGEGRRLALGPLPSRVIAMLLLSPNEIVASPRLIDGAWDGHPPATARRQLQNTVSMLRQRFAASAAGSPVIIGDRIGYRICIDQRQLDACRFHELTAEAKASVVKELPESAVEQLRAALALWRGPALAGVGGHVIEAAAVRLDEQRLAALEQCLDLELQLGRHPQVMGELAELVASYPLREQLVGLFMRALHGSGRRADALAAYQQLRARLAEDLGLDPGSGLQQLHAAVLRDEIAAPAGATDATVEISGAHASVDTPRPKQVPRDTTWFTGRGVELERVLEAAETGSGQAESAVVISAIDGMAGIGKTSLAVHAAHRLAGRFPDGQLFLDLHGFSTGAAFVEPAEALHRLLSDVGVPGERIPPGLEERAALWRSVLVGRRMLILLDNAATERQVQPLLPGAMGCLVVVTSRRRLAALEATLTISLDMLPPADAVELFVRTAGRSELTTDSPEVRQVIELCGRLPLAIRIAAARLKHRPVWTVADLAGWLRDGNARLTALDDGQRSVAAALDLSYRHLAPDVRRAYRLLGLHPGPSIDAYAVAALTDTTLTAANGLLGRLVENHLLLELTPGRYGFHDLVRAHAAHLAAAGKATEPELGGALDRLLDHYARCVVTAMDQLFSRHVDRAPRPPDAGTPCPDLNHPARASAWLDAELPNLLATADRAADSGRHGYLLHLSGTLVRWLRVSGRHGEVETLCRLALEVARIGGDRAAELDALTGLGHTNRMQARYEAAVDHLQKALDIARAIGDRRTELDALDGLARVHRLQGRYRQAIVCFEHVVNVAHASGDRSAELEARLGLGWLDRLRRRYSRAAGQLQRAQAIARAIGNRRAEVDAANALGVVHGLQGNYAAAIDHFDLAEEIANETGNHMAALIATFGRGGVLRQQGRLESAANHFQQVLDLAHAIGNRNWQFEATHALGRIHRAAGRPELALGCHQRALELATSLNQPADQARAHSGLAYAHDALGHPELAGSQWRRALDQLTTLGIDRTEDEETTSAAIRAHLKRLGRRQRDS